MFRRQYLAIIIVAATCLALVAEANETTKAANNDNAPNPAATTIAPAVAAVVTAVDSAIGKDLTAAPPADHNSGPAAATGAPKLPAALLDAIASSPAVTTTAKPTATPPVSGTGAPAAGPEPTKSSSGVVTSAPAATGGAQAANVHEKLEQYFEPVCAAVDGNKLLPKQLFKLQSQLKQFVERTSGKMSLCFMGHFGMDPNLTPVTKDQLVAICSARSKALGADAKGSFKAFLACSANNWDPNLDQELDRIIAARISFTKAHNHGPNESLDHSHDDDEEFTMIGDVVKKVLDGNKDVASKPGIKIIDVSGPAATAAVANKLASEAEPRSQGPSTAAPLANLLLQQPANGKLSSEPNTVVVFVDEPAAGKKDSSVVATTPAPKVTSAGASSNSAKPVDSVAPKEGPNASTTAAPASVEITVAASSGNASTSAPLTLHTNSKSVGSTIAVALGQAKTTTSIPSTGKPDSSASSSTTTKTPGEGALSATSTDKPVESLQQMLKRQEKEKQELEAKLRVEREKIMKQLQKKQDEIDARNAIKALQLQRQTGGHAGGHADAKLHQMEHERQMSIDPVGHTIKHQQYELSRQHRSSVTILSG